MSPQWVRAEKGCLGHWNLMAGRRELASVDGGIEPGEAAVYRLGRGEPELCWAGHRAAMRICEAALGLAGEDTGRVGRRIVGRAA